MLFLRLKLLPLILSSALGLAMPSVDLKQSLVDILQDKFPKKIEFSQVNYTCYPSDIVTRQISRIPKSNAIGCYDTAIWNLACLRQSCPGIAAGLVFGGKVIRDIDGTPLPNPVEVNHLWVIVMTSDGGMIEVGGSFADYDYITYVRF